MAGDWTMASFLSPGWLVELGEALEGQAAGGAGAAEMTLSVRQRVIGGPHGEVSYIVSIADGRVTVVSDPGPEVTADAELVVPWPVAMAVSQGTVTPAAAFGAARLRLAGNVGLLVRHGEALAALARATASLRATTTY